MATRVKTNPDITIHGLRNELKMQYGIDVSDMKLYPTRTKAKGENEVNHVASFQKLRQYAHMVRHTNPESDTILECHVASPKSLPMFKRFSYAWT